MYQIVANDIQYLFVVCLFVQISFFVYLTCTLDILTMIISLVTLPQETVYTVCVRHALSYMRTIVNSHKIELCYCGGLIAGALRTPAAGTLRPRQFVAERLKHIAQCNGHQCHIVGGHVARGHHLAVSDS